MATFIFTGFQPTFFNGLRDANGVQLGYIEPGQIVDIAEAPNGQFAPVDVPQVSDISPDPSPSPVASPAIEPVAPEVPEPAPQAVEPVEPVIEPAPEPAPQPSAPAQVIPLLYNPAQVIVH